MVTAFVLKFFEPRKHSSGFPSVKVLPLLNYTRGGPPECLKGVSMNISYTYNKMAKIQELCKIIRGSIVKDVRRNGLSFADFAHEIGLSQGTLENKLKPASPHDVTVTELIHIMDITADYAPLEYIARRYGFILCKAEEERSRIENTTAFVTINTLDLGAVFGELERIVKEAIEDGQIDERESKEISDIAYEIRKLAKKLEEIAKGGDDG